MSIAVPTYAVEKELASALGGRAVVAGIDEVGRGALAGPVAVGACAVTIADGRVASRLPRDVRDSKVLTPARREALVGPITRGAAGCAVGWASPREIDRMGLAAALTAAALRALRALDAWPHAVIVDGSVDVLTTACMRERLPVPRVAVRVKADRHCRTVAAASVLAKAARDAHMAELHDGAPHYAWASNKGYGSIAHREALSRHGIHGQHRASWNLMSIPAAGVLWDLDPHPSAPGEEGDR